MYKSGMLRCSTVKARKGRTKARRSVFDCSETWLWRREAEKRGWNGETQYWWRFERKWLHRLSVRGTIRRYVLVGVGVALLEEVRH